MSLTFFGLCMIHMFDLGIYESLLNISAFITTSDISSIRQIRRMCVIHYRHPSIFFSVLVLVTNTG